MKVNDFAFRHGTPNKEDAQRYLAEIGFEPGNIVDNDTAAGQIRGLLTMLYGQFNCIGCYDGKKLVGMLAFKEGQIEEYPSILLYNFAVLPPVSTSRDRCSTAGFGQGEGDRSADLRQGDKFASLSCVNEKRFLESKRTCEQSHLQMEQLS